jgi:hypothetical protein
MTREERPKKATPNASIRITVQTLNAIRRDDEVADEEALTLSTGPSWHDRYR